MPPGMFKRAVNTTQYRAKGDTFAWRLHLVFIVTGAYHVDALLKTEPASAAASAPGTEAAAADGSGASELLRMSVSENSLVRMALPAVDDRRTLADVLSDFLDPRPDNAVQRHALRALRGPRAAGQLRCLVQSIPSVGTDPTFLEVPLGFTLRAALAHKTVIEYPTLFFGSVEHTQKLKMHIAEVAPADAVVRSRAIAKTMTGALRRRRLRISLFKSLHYDWRE